MSITSEEAALKRGFDDAVQDADHGEALRNVLRTKFRTSGSASDRAAYQTAERKMRIKQRRARKSTIDVFLGSVGSLAITKSDYEEAEEDGGVYPLIDSEATSDSPDNDAIDNDTGPSDGYNRGAELAAMAEEEAQYDDTTQVTDSS